MIEYNTESVSVEIYDNEYPFSELILSGYDFSATMDYRDPDDLREVASMIEDAADALGEAQS